MWTIFEVLIVCYNIALVLCFGVLASRHVGSYPQPGFKPAPPALEGKVLTTGLPGKSLNLY